MLNFLDKLTKGPRGHFHKNPYISGGYENGGLSLFPSEIDTSQLQTILRSIVFGPGKDPKTHRSRQQTAPDGI